MKPFLILFVSVALISCDTNSSGKQLQEESTEYIQNGIWRFSIKNEHSEIPFLAELTTGEDATFTIINAGEELSTKNIRIDSHTISIELPVFSGILRGKIDSPGLITGHYIRTDEEDYELPFIAEAGKNFLFTNANTSITTHNRYRVTFRPESENSYPAILLLEQDSLNHLSGTFLTETGDYRYLSGNIMNNQIHLSGFSGATLYYFVADISQDSLTNGMFYSGKRSKRSWQGVYDPEYQLSNANDLTHLKQNVSGFDFNLPNQNGQPVSLVDLKPQNTVAIVEIMGSWCPNCMDAARTLHHFQEKYNNDLVIIPIAFENTEDLAQARPRLQKMQKDLGISGNKFVFGGIASAENVLAKLPALNEFRSYPTLIFIDKNDSVRSIYTGFYGPGTGVYYQSFMEHTDSLLQQLISE